MNLMLHVVAKDFRRLRDRLAWWFGMMVLKTGVALWLVWGPGVDDATFDQVGQALIVLVSAEVALTFLLAAMIVQEDPLVGEQPFWRTRPISGCRLFGAKAVGLCVLLGLPVVLAALPWWMACGGGVAEIAWATGQLLIVQLIVIAPAVLMASLTETLGRFLVWSLVLLAAHSMPSTLLPMLGNKSLNLPAAVVWTQLVAYFSVVLLAGSAVVVAQYLGVGRRNSIVGFVAGWIVALGVAFWWPRDWRIESVKYMPDNRTEAAAIGLEVAAVKFVPRLPRSAYENLNTHVRIKGLPAGRYLGGTKSEHHWQWSDGTEDRVRGWGFPSHHGMLEAASAALKGTAPSGAAEMHRPEAYWNPVFGATLSPTQVARIRSGPSTYTLKAELALFRPEVWTMVPVQGGGWQVHSGRGLRVLRMNPPGPDHKVNASLLTTEFTSAPGGVWRLVLTGQRLDPGTMPFFLVDKAQGRVKPLWQSVAGKLIIAGIEVSVPLVELSESNVTAPLTRGLAVAWMGWHREATFTRSATVERLELD